MNKLPPPLLLTGCLLLAAASLASADIVAVTDHWTVNTVVPVGNPVGITASETFTGLNPDPITSVSLGLNLLGGYNGALFASLTLQDPNGQTATEVLLNQVGLTPDNPFASAGAGFDHLTLTDTATANGTIHNAPGIPAGAWQPDSPVTLDDTFAGLTADGTWTLFIADLDSGTPAPTLADWNLNVTTADSVITTPEPGQATGMAILGLIVLGTQTLRRMRQTKLVWSK